MKTLPHTTILPLLLICTCALLSACSHTSPWVAPGTPATAQPPAQELTLVHRVLLIGDAGNVTPSYPGALDTARTRAKLAPGKTTMVFLGDNIYEDGLLDEADPSYAEAAEHLETQLKAAADSDATAYFIPGNHDWDHYREGGQAAAIRQTRFIKRAIERFPSIRAEAVPQDAAPGPIVRDLEHVRLIFLDTQWWLHPYERPLVKPETVLAELNKAVSTAGKREVMILAHHPFRTHGPHGAFFDWTDHLFPLHNIGVGGWFLPLPLIGSLYPLGRTLFAHDQDAFSDIHQAMIRGFTQSIDSARPLLYASGHEHSLQVMRSKEGPRYILVSGSGSKTSSVTHGPDSLFAHEVIGLMEVDTYSDGSFLLRVFDDSNNLLFSHWLTTAQSRVLQK